MNITHMKNDLAYIEHILLSIEKIQAYTSGISKEDFFSNEMIQDAVIRNFEIIGEATKKVSDDLKLSCSEVPWRLMAGMRDKLIHDYLGVDLEMIWVTIEIDIPQLKKLLENIN